MLLALYPPTAWDATIYHLPLARRLVEAGALELADNLRFPVFPMAAETLFAPGLWAGDGRAAQMVSAFATLATAVLLLAWGRERLGPSPIAAFPAALWLGHPIVVYYSGTAFVEPLLALFTTASFYAIDRCRREPGVAAALLAGAFAGWAAATKYLALPVPPLAAVALLLAVPAGWRWRAIAAFAGGCTLAAAPFYLWIWGATGNPVFPFLPGIFGASPWSDIEGTGLRLHGTLGERLATTLRLPWAVVADRAQVGAQPPYSPFVLAALPAGAWAALRAPWTRPLLALLALLAAGFAWLPGDSRYLLGGAPAIGLALAVASEDLLRRAPVSAPGRQRLAAALVLCAILPGPVYAAWRVARLGPPPLGAAATQAFLRRELPLYGAVESVQRLGGDAATLYGFHAERTIFWYSGRQIGDWNGPFRFSTIEPLLADPERLWLRLRGYGADYLLVPRSPDAALPGAALPALPGFGRRFRVVHEDPEARVFALRPARGE